MEKGFLLLADGTLFTGKACGETGCAIGEVVFNTGMTGYEEVLTDPSYFGQITTMTYPLMGNYGVNKEDMESARIHLSGFLMRNLCETPSNFRSEGTLHAFLKKNGTVGLYGIDTRRLTRMLRECGVMNGAIGSGEPPLGREKEELLERIKAFSVKDAVQAVTRSDIKVWEPAGEMKYKVAIIDFGAKRNIMRSLLERGCQVSILPALADPKEYIEGQYDGIMLSNGPGDPAENREIIENLKQLLSSGVPTFGICLGHQLVALAAGAKTGKLKYGHRGANHPVRDNETGRCLITSQNHGYAVLKEDLPAGVKVSHENLNDGTVEGLSFDELPVFTVQFHPEAWPGPLDTAGLFNKFTKMMDKGGE